MILPYSALRLAIYLTCMYTYRVLPRLLLLLCVFLYCGFVIACRMTKVVAGGLNLIQSSVFFLFKHDLFIVNPLRSFLCYILSNYGHARSQGGRQPPAANPPLYACILYILRSIGDYTFLAHISAESKSAQAYCQKCFRDVVCGVCISSKLCTLRLACLSPIKTRSTNTRTSVYYREVKTWVRVRSNRMRSSIEDNTVLVSPGPY